MHKVIKRCKFCKYCKGDHSYFYCASSLSSKYMEQVYPEEENCEVFLQNRKPKKKKKFKLY